MDSKASAMIEAVRSQLHDRERRRSLCSGGQAGVHDREFITIRIGELRAMLAAIDGEKEPRDAGELHAAAPPTRIR